MTAKPDSGANFKSSTWRLLARLADENACLVARPGRSSTEHKHVITALTKSARIRDDDSSNRCTPVEWGRKFAKATDQRLPAVLLQLGIIAVARAKEAEAVTRKEDTKAWKSWATAGAPKAAHSSV